VLFCVLGEVVVLVIYSIQLRWLTLYVTRVLEVPVLSQSFLKFRCAVLACSGPIAARMRDF